jgi:hypothetical protein
MKKDLLTALRRELENSFGRKILSSRDCLQMVEDIYQKTGDSINANTLRRFFGLVKTDYSPSPSTLTILSRYCGFNSIDEIENISTGNVASENINQEEVLHYLVSLFKHLTVAEGLNEIVESLVQQTVIFLERNSSLIDRFQREIAKTPSGQYYYYELSVNMDRLNDYYGDGLRHYLRTKNTMEARVFANSLLVFRYWLTDNLPLMEKHMSAMSDISILQSFPSHVLGRLVAARIYYASARHESTDRILIDATKFHVAIMANRGNAHSSFPYFELAVCEALILTNQHEEAIEFIRRGKPFLPQVKDGQKKNPFGLWESIINSKKNTSLKKLDLTKKPPPTPFYNSHLNKKYSNLLMLLQNTRSRNKQLSSLILETGFKKFGGLNARQH